MTLEGLLAEIVTLLEAAGIPHMVAGSVASSHHGQPRMTQDLDLVIAPTRESLASFVGSLHPSRYYVGDAMRAFDKGDAFNVIDISTGWKVDLIPRKERDFSHTEFERRVPVVLAGVSTAVATVEDTILAKLEWSRAGGSERQINDVVAMLVAQGGTVDRPYLRHWAERLGVGDLLDFAFDRAQGGEPAG